MNEVIIWYARSCVSDNYFVHKMTHSGACTTNTTLDPNIQWFYISCSCLFDGVKGKIANLLCTTVALIIVLVINLVLYILTWYRIRKEQPKFDNNVRGNSTIFRPSRRVARNVRLFIAAFIVQWWAAAICGVWYVVDADVPTVLFHCVTIFTNIGGFLNMFVYFILRRRFLLNESVEKTKHSTQNTTLRTQNSHVL